MNTEKQSLRWIGCYGRRTYPTLQGLFYVTEENFSELFAERKCMREILFKAKTEMIVDTYNCGKEDGEWVQGYLRCDCGKWLIYQFETDRADQVAYEVNPDTICQFTGLTDKNGNKIWENDIIGTDVGNVKVAYVTDPSPYENHYNAGFEVLFANVTDNENYRHDLGYWAILRGFEAVGNTFDNPELWK